MKNLKTKSQETFQYQLKKFKMLIVGSKMAKASSIFLICISFIFMFYSEKNMLVIISLLIGIAVLVVYIVKFLLLKNIEQKSYTLQSLTSSISKFKAYIRSRKKFELLYISIWVISLIPFLSSYLGSDLKAIIAAIIFITITAVLGILGFKKATKDLEAIETQLQTEFKTLNGL
ncbi:hypothetical protein [Gillisia hiemivivida]|uniref:DUF2721 domain-containing protein n=1 Tax=Gillisia hiemivivida TaxID=291190 RepID=A0A5C6ZPK8_9FLAO|nr:hypothetical protein [Gillisia hiemivivida]TXD92683.1 hypothetical protein ES724_12960 [Gillisia hiemivivida]